MTAPIGPDRPWEKKGWMPSGVRPDTSAPAGPWNDPGWAPSGYVASADKSNAAYTSPANAHQSMTVKDVLRLGAAGLIPGWSDEIVARLKSLKPGLTYAEAVAQERAGLKEARSKAGHTFIELGAGLAGGGALGKVAEGTGVAAKTVRALTGLGGDVPQTALRAAGTGARVGATVGALAGSGNADDGSLVQRILGGGIGAAVGAPAGAATGLLAHAAFKNIKAPTMNRADMAEAGLSGPEGERAVREMSDAFKRGGADPAAARTAIAGGDIAPEYPLTVADVGGPATRSMVAQAEVAGGEIPSVQKAAEFLDRRTEELPLRQSRAVSRATGKATISPAAALKQMEAQRRAVGDVMFQRFRDAAKRATSWTMGTTPEVEAALQDPAVRTIVKEVESAMGSGARSGRLAAGEKFVSPYVTRAKAGASRATPGSFKGATPDLEVRGAQDPITLSEISRRLGEKANKARLKGNNVNASDLFRFKKAIDDQLETIPEFADANRVMARMHDYESAMDEGSKLKSNVLPETVDHETSAYRAQTPLDLPEDVAAAVAKAAGLPEGSTALPSAWPEYQRGAQASRVTRIQGRTTPVPENVNLKAVDELIFGEGPAAQMRAGTETEKQMGLLDQMNPRSNPQLQAQQQGAKSALVRDIFYGVNSPKLGIALSLGDIARLGAYKMFRPSTAEVGAELTGLLNTGSARDATLRLIEQAQRSLNTPLRRGLLNAGLYGAAGIGH